MSANLPPLPRGRRMGSGVINGKLIELFMHDDAAMLAYATAALSAQATEMEALRADVERLQWILSHPETCAEELEDACASLLDPRTCLERRKAAIEAAERERCARVCELRGRALEAARAHAEGSLQGANPKYWGPLLSLAAELAESIRRA